MAPPRTYSKLARVSALALAAWAAVAASRVLGAATGCVAKPPAVQATNPVVLGASLGLTGSLAPRSAFVLNALRAAEGQINAAGGVLGRQVRIDVVDDRSDSADFIDGVIRKFADDKVAAVIGPRGSAQVSRVHGILRDRGIPLITPTATSSTLTGVQPARERFLFRTVADDDRQGKALVQLALRGPDFGKADAGASKKCLRMAIVYVKNTYGEPMANVIKGLFTDAGGMPVEFIDVGESVVTNYEDVVGRVLAVRPTCMALIQYPDVGSAIMRELDKQRRASPTALPADFFVMGTDSTFTQGFVESSRESKTDPGSRNAADNMVGVSPQTSPPTPEYNEFKDIYLSYFPAKPGDAGAEQLPAFIANSFDAVVLMALAIQQAGTATDGVKIRDALYAVSKGGKLYTPSQLSDALQAIRQGGDIDYRGASGEVDLDDFGNVISDFVVWKIDKGVLTTVGNISAKELGQ